MKAMSRKSTNVQCPKISQSPPLLKLKGESWLKAFEMYILLCCEIDVAPSAGVE